MTSTKSKMDECSEKIAEIKLERDTTHTNTSQASYFNETQQGSKKVNFVRLEKGLLFTVNFNTHWYRHGMNRRSIYFSQISSEFLTYFNGIFVGFYDGRLKSCGASTAWT